MIPADRVPIHRETQSRGSHLQTATTLDCELFSQLTLNVKDSMTGKESGITIFLWGYRADSRFAHKDHLLGRMLSSPICNESITNGMAVLSTGQGAPRCAKLNRKAGVGRI